MAKHRIKLSPTGGIIEVNGVNVANSVVGLQFSSRVRAEGGQHLHLALDLLVDKGSKLEADGVEISIPDATARVLKLLGWTPPADDFAPTMMIDEIRHDSAPPDDVERCPAARVLWPDDEAIEVRCERDAGHEGEHRGDGEEWSDDD